MAKAKKEKSTKQSKKPLKKASTPSKVLSKAAKKKTKEEQKLDGGIGPIEKAEIRKVMRQLWMRLSKARKIVVKRCLTDKGFSKCELCGETVPKIHVDHIKVVGELDEGYLERLWCSSKEMQGICDQCHNGKTKEERKEAKEKKAQQEFLNVVQSFDELI